MKTIQKTIFYVETNQKIVIFRKIGKKNLDVSEPEAASPPPRVGGGGDSEYWAPLGVGCVAMGHGGQAKSSKILLPFFYEKIRFFDFFLRKKYSFQLFSPFPCIFYQKKRRKP